MLPGLDGTLVTAHFAERMLPELDPGLMDQARAAAARAHFRRWYARVTREIGPVTAVRGLVDVAAAPLAETLGFRIASCRPPSTRDQMVLDLDPGDGTIVPLLVVPWAASLDATWRNAAKEGAAAGSRWACCFNAHRVRVVDAQRPYARAFVEFDLERVAEDAALASVFFALLRAESFRRAPCAGGGGRPMSGGLSLFASAVEASARHAVGVCAGLKTGMIDALQTLTSGLVASATRRARRASVNAPVEAAFADALTVAYRILFLLFAEARGLVPVWHPVYRDSYTLGALVEATGGTLPAHGLWEALSAIARLAHEGCRAGDLAVNAFNGRLFSPDCAPVAESAAMADQTVARVLSALSTTEGPRGLGRQRISFRDLGVEELGAVYETVLDYEPRLEAPLSARVGTHRGRATVRLSTGGTRRKGTGSFYTPRSLTEFLVRAALHPLVEHASSGQILGLRILDPAMGSGAFLVAACHYLAAAYERALFREGAAVPSDVGEPDRAGFRRTIAERCLFGVDLNPVAVQLARLSLWLATLAADRPLTFLDHHLAVGDSLIGATLADVARCATPAGARASRAARPLPLFDPVDAADALEPAVLARRRLALEPGDTLAAVRQKERQLAALGAEGGPLARWKSAANLWCAAWFWPDGASPDGALVRDLAQAALAGHSSLPERTRREWLARMGAVAAERHFFHWDLEFPEVFFDADGAPRADAGFDAVIGNPPWDMVRADDAGRDDRKRLRLDVQALTRFARDAGVYRYAGDGHVNRYQLFLERALALARPGGRVGLLVPSGLATDQGCRGLRRALFDRCATDAIIGFDNGSAIFPIHRGVRFLAVTATAGAPPGFTRCRFGVRTPTELDAVPDEVGTAGSDQLPITLSSRLLTELSGDALEIPDLRDTKDLAILARIRGAFRSLGAQAGWNVALGRELNATDDRKHFAEAPAAGPDALPVLEGKHVAPFFADPAASHLRLPRPRADSLRARSSAFGRPRLACRDVASASNRLTLIAAIVPAGAVTTHTLLCARNPLTPEAAHCLCGLLNSYVANYLVRLRMTTHIGVRNLSWLPVPVVPAGSPPSEQMAALAAEVAATAASGHGVQEVRAARAPGAVQPVPTAQPVLGPSTIERIERSPAYVRLQAVAARMYECDGIEMDRILETFPLVPLDVRRAVAREFARLTR